MKKIVYLNKYVHQLFPKKQLSKKETFTLPFMHYANQLIKATASFKKYIFFSFYLLIYLFIFVDENQHLFYQPFLRMYICILFSCQPLCITIFTKNNYPKKRLIFSNILYLTLIFYFLTHSLSFLFFSLTLSLLQINSFLLG